MKLIPDNFKEEIYRRLEKITSELEANGADAAVIGSNVNIYYTTGRFFRGYVYIPKNHHPFWFVIKPQVFDTEDDVIFIRKPENIPDFLINSGLPIPSSIALEENDLSYADIIRLKKLFPEAVMINGSSILKKARMVKTPWEINEMKIDGYHHAKVYGEVKECYRPGMTDLQLQIEIERKLRLEGALGVSRVAGNLMEINLGSVINGDNADTPGPYEFTMTGAGVHESLPVGADNSPILPGRTVMIDMNGAFNGYQTDMTRVWSLGDIADLAQKAHQCSIKILRTFEKTAVPGCPVKDLYSIALQIVEEENLKDFFMGHVNKVGFIGHGVGIELNELPVITPKSADILQANMTIAIEPKFVIPHVGAVGIENTYVVTESGLNNITVFPEEIMKF